MSGKTRAGIAGIVGAVVAFGVAELIHGLFSSVPSVFVALVQGIIEFTPGELVTRGIEILGQADIPVLITCTVIGALIFSAVLAILAARRPALALIGVGVLAAIGIAASLAEPFVAPVPTVITIDGALALFGGDGRRSRCCGPEEIRDVPETIAFAGKLGELLGIVAR